MASKKGEGRITEASSMSIKQLIFIFLSIVLLTGLQLQLLGQQTDGWRKQSGNWIFKNGELTSEAVDTDKYAIITDSHLKSNSLWATVGIDFKYTKNANSFGLIVNSANSSNWGGIMINPTKDSFFLTKWYYGKSRIYGGFKIEQELKEGNWYRLEVTKKDRKKPGNCGRFL